MTATAADSEHHHDAARNFAIGGAGPDEEQFQLALNQLSRLSTERLTVADILISVTQIAARAVPGTAAASLVVVENDQTDTVTATTPVADTIEQLQRRIGQGPAITAAATRRTVTSGNVAVDPRWPRFTARAARLGINSVLSLPLLAGQDLIGNLTLYARQTHVFDHHATQLAELFAQAAAITVHTTQQLAQTQRLVQRLQTALTQQTLIDRAIGIMIDQHGGTAEAAYVRLRTASQRHKQKLGTTAQTLVNDTTRHPPGPPAQDPITADT